MARLETTPERSRNMSRIKGWDTKPELALRRALRAAGLCGYRKNYKGVFGTPDVAFTGYKLAVFADGGLWHGKDFGKRGARLAAGWAVLRFWDDEVLKDPGKCTGIVVGKLEELKRGEH